VGPSTKKNFIQELDEAGARGFKVVSTVGGFPVALGKRDDVQREYALFLTKGNFWNKGGFEASYTHLSRQGFQLIAGLDVGESCEDFTPMGAMPYRECVYTDLFLAERQKGVDETAREQRLAFTGPSFRNKTATALNKQIGDRLDQGYYPTFLLSKFEILLELTGKQNESVDKADVRVVASGSRDDLAKEVNEMAKQGYRLSMVNKKIALMRRNRADATPTSYVWLDATEEDFENQLTQMQEQGAIYRMTYPSDRRVKNKLIFEQKASGDNTQREYKILKLELSHTADAANQHITTDLKSESKETMKLLNTMVKGGYVVCDLFLESSFSDNNEAFILPSLNPVTSTSVHGPTSDSYEVLMMRSK